MNATQIRRQVAQLVERTTEMMEDPGSSLITTLTTIFPTRYADIKGRGPSPSAHHLLPTQSLGVVANSWVAFTIPRIRMLNGGPEDRVFHLPAWFSEAIKKNCFL